MKRVLTNRVLLFNSASSSFFILGLIGYWTFMPKYMETQFRQTAANSNFASGAIGILSSGLGIVTSGLIISKFKPSPRSLALWNFVTEFVEVVGHVLYIFLGCTVDDLHGQWNADKTLVSELYRLVLSSDSPKRTNLLHGHVYQKVTVPANIATPLENDTGE